MAGFRFKFEVLLKQREREENERQRDLAKHLRRSMILQNQLRQMQQTITDSKQQLGGSLVGVVKMDAVSNFARYSGQVTTRAYSLVHEIAKVERLSEAAREQLLEASRKRKALELLRDRQKARWKLKQDRLEAAALDEMNVQHYARQLMTGAIQ